MEFAFVWAVSQPANLIGLKDHYRSKVLVGKALATQRVSDFHKTVILGTCLRHTRLFSASFAGGFYGGMLFMFAQPF